VGVELAAPAEVNWRESYTRVHEWPYGCRILYEELPALFPEAPVEARSAAPYRATYQSPWVGTNRRLNYDEVVVVESLLRS